MKFLIVYDSVFGNTERIAGAIGGALAEFGEVLVRRASEASPGELRGADFLVLGSPTRAFSPTKDVKAFLSAIPARGLEGIRTAAFDTRISAEESGSRLLVFLVKLLGYAAGSLEKGLAKKGGRAALRAEGFFVQASEGPLKEGELERAASWARLLLVSQTLLI